MIVPEFSRIEPKGDIIKKFLENSSKWENLSCCKTKDLGYFQES